MVIPHRFCGRQKKNIISLLYFFLFSNFYFFLLILVSAPASIFVPADCQDGEYKSLRLWVTTHLV